MRNLILMREQALEIRHKTHLDHMKKMLENRRFSPRTFQNKQIELEKWITKERENIQRTKKDIEKGWLSTADSIQRVIFSIFINLIHQDSKRFTIPSKDPRNSHRRKKHQHKRS